jgi:preprotein translocase SecE subunit
MVVAETAEITSANKLQAGIDGFKGFLGEVKIEMQKCTWPTRVELKEQTIVVCVSVLLLGAVIWISDTVLMGIMRIIF